MAYQEILLNVRPFCCRLPHYFRHHYHVRHIHCPLPEIHLLWNKLSVNLCVLSGILMQNLWIVYLFDLLLFGFFIFHNYAKLPRWPIKLGVIILISALIVMLILNLTGQLTSVQVARSLITIGSSILIGFIIIFWINRKTRRFANFGIFLNILMALVMIVIGGIWLFNQGAMDFSYLVLLMLGIGFLLIMRGVNT
jgi:hypothetical protein